MISLLIGAAVAFGVTVLGTPFLIRVLQSRGAGQLIRDDGPFTHPHAGKAGTPTMGGLAIVGGAVLGYAVAHVRGDALKFARTGLTLMFVIVGMAVVGFIDDYLAIRRGRNLESSDWDRDFFWMHFGGRPALAELRGRESWTLRRCGDRSSE